MKTIDDLLKDKKVTEVFFNTEQEIEQYLDRTYESLFLNFFIEQPKELDLLTKKVKEIEEESRTKKFYITKSAKKEIDLLFFVKRFFLDRMITFDCPDAYFQVDNKRLNGLLDNIANLQGDFESIYKKFLEEFERIRYI